METRPLVSLTLFLTGELAEIAGGLGDDVIVELENNAAGTLAIDSDIELQRYD